MPMYQRVTIRKAFVRDIIEAGQSIAKNFGKNESP
jgi:hypothetical protein